MIINIGDDTYPNILQTIPYAPKKLYVLGNEKLLKEKCLAIVGSRECTKNGAKLAEEYAKYFCDQNYCIVSGMAEGIDTSAHIGALKSKGKTIAVLGSGFKHIFPRESIKLFNEILNKGGAIVSEYEENTGVTSKGFVMRDRIISGLSIGVVVVEAKSKSGTAITVDFAKKQGRKIFYISNNDNNNNNDNNKYLKDEANKGDINYFIKKGAELITCPKDVLVNLK